MNKFRNESILLVDDEEFILRPTFEALAQIESKISTGSIELLLDQSIRGEIKINDARIVIVELAKEGGTPLPEQALIDYFEQHGSKWIKLYLQTEVLPKIVFGGEQYQKILQAQFAAAADMFIEEDGDEKKPPASTSTDSTE